MNRLARSFILSQIELAQNHLRVLQSMVIAMGQEEGDVRAPVLREREPSLEAELEGFGEIYSEPSGL